MSPPDSSNLFDPACTYPVLLRLVVAGDWDLTMSDLRKGSETTMTAVHISAVHHRSVRGLVGVTSDEAAQATLTSVGVSDVVIHIVYDETGETNGHGDNA